MKRGPIKRGAAGVVVGLAMLAVGLAVVVPADATETGQQPEVLMPTIAQIEAGPAVGRVPTGNLVVPGQDPPVLRPFPPAISGPAGVTGGEPRPAVPQPKPATWQHFFEGTTQTVCCSRPPDTHGAVGLAHFVEVTNPGGGSQGYRVMRKSDGVATKTVTLNSFFGYGATTIFDPQLVYDKAWNRFIVFAEAYPETQNTQYLFLGVSKGPDPNGAYWLYQFDYPTNNQFYDYPKLGMDQDALIVTANIFAPAINPTSYVETTLFAIPKQRAYNGLGFSVPVISLGQSNTAVPPMVEDENDAAFLISGPLGSNMNIYRMEKAGRKDVSVAFQGAVADPAGFATPPNADQFGTSIDLDSLDGRFVNFSPQIGDELINVRNKNIGGFSGGRYYIFDTEGTGANTVERTGTIVQECDSDDWNFSVAASGTGATDANPIGRFVFTWSSIDGVSGCNAGAYHARVMGAGRTRAEVDANSSLNGTGISVGGPAPTAYTGGGFSVERWGDYSAVSLDPVSYTGCPAGNRFWLVNERHVSATLWGSRVARFGFC